MSTSKIEYKEFVAEGEGEDVALQIVRGKIAGYAMVYGNVDQVSDRAHMGCAAKDVRDAAGMPMGWQHDIKNPLGVTLDAAEHPRSQLPSFVTQRFPDATGGLWVKGQTVLTRENRDRLQMVQEGPVRGLSVGYVPKVFDYSTEAGGSVRNLREISLKEWSPVTIGANPAALITEVKSFPGAFDGSYEDLRHKVETAVDEAKLYGPDKRCSVVATYSDRVLIECRPLDDEARVKWEERERVYEVPWVMGQDGAITFGQSTEVEILRTVSPVMKAQMDFMHEASRAFVDLKEGRMLSDMNMGRIREACGQIGGGHAALMELLDLAGGKAQKSATATDEQPSDETAAPNLSAAERAFEAYLRGDAWRRSGVASPAH